MPASPPFDERHLRDVVLAQTEEIRPASRLPGLRALIRPVVALAAVVAIIAIGLGIKDYLEQKNPSSPAGSSIPTVEPTKAISPKKTASGKTGRTRTSATEATAEETAQAATAAAEMEKPLILGQSADQQAIATENGPNTPTAQAGRDERDAAIGRDNGVANEHDAIAKPGSPACLPLPNGTHPEDVDAPYYFGWAIEYCGHDLRRPSATPKLPETQPSKR